METTSGWELLVCSSLSLVVSVAKWSGYEIFSQLMTQEHNIVNSVCSVSVSLPL